MIKEIVKEDNMLTPAVKPRMYVVIDSRTGDRMCKPTPFLKKAHRKADRLDLEYGAVRYVVEPLKENASGGSVGGGAIAAVPGRLGDMRKRESLKQFLVRFHKKVANRWELKPVHMPVIKEYYDLSDVVARLKGVDEFDAKKDNTVTFGVEDDKGNVMKVTVKKEQSKEFEYKLARDLSDAKDNNLAGTVKLSLAELLYNLKDEFDIVDVEFPKIPKDVIYNADKATKAPENVETEGTDQIGDMDQENGEMGADQGMEGMEDAEGPPPGLEGAEGGEQGAEGEEVPFGDEEEGPEPDDESVENFEEEPESATPESILQSVMDMLKADAEAKKAQAEADAEEARAKTAEWSYKSSQATVAHQEELARMESDMDQQKDKEKEAKRMADLAKYRVQKASSMRENANSILAQVINEIDDFDTQQTVNKEKQIVQQKYKVAPDDSPDEANFKQRMMQQSRAELNDRQKAVRTRDTFDANQKQKARLAKSQASNQAIKDVKDKEEDLM